MLSELLALDIVGTASDLWKIGGTPLISMLMMGTAVWLILRFTFRRMDNRDKRNAEVEDSRVEILATVAKDNTAAFHAMVAVGEKQVEAANRTTDTLNRLITCMAELPCYRGQIIPAIPQSPARRDRTPLPQTYKQP